MARAETNVVTLIMQRVSLRGVRLWKNVRGIFLTLDGKRKIMAGLLAPGASDLVGFTPVVITPEMVGRTVAVFTVMEVKTLTGRASEEQKDYVRFVKENGGIAGIPRSPEDAEKIISEW